jgi:hypothetical protein
VSDEIVRDLWNERSAWSATADKIKSDLVRWRAIALAATIGGAALQTLAASIAVPKSPVGAAGVVLLALVPFVRVRFLAPEQNKKWLRSRSVAEGMKSEIFLYRAGAEPYTGATALDRLRKKVREIEGWGKGLESDLARATPQNSPAPPELDSTAYLARRVNQQIDSYYRPKAKLNATRAEQFRWAETALAGLAALLGAWASFSGVAGVGPWVAVLTTVGGGITAHSAAGRYDFQATTYFATARQLKDLENDWLASGKTAPSKEWSDFVQSCEEVISAENRGWMAKLDQPQ